MNLIFTIIDKSGRTIYLTTERWKHITSEHPNVNDIEEMKQTLAAPLTIKPSTNDPDRVRWYYCFYKEQKRYLMVAVKYLNGEGFVITAYYVRRIK